MFNRFLITAMFVAFLSITSLQASDPVDAADRINPLLVGSQIPAITLTSKDGQEVDLTKAAGEKPIILIFYRGGW